MRARSVAAAGVGGLMVVACAAIASNQVIAAPGQAAEYAYRNATTAPPPGWTGPVFELSHDYPRQHPGTCPETVCTWLALDVEFPNGVAPTAPDWSQPVWNEYISRILRYLQEGQDAQLSNAAGFRAEVNGRTRWFHVPWMAYDPTAGREFVHGLTNERTAHLADLLGDEVGDGEGSGTHLLEGTLPSCAQRNVHGFESWSVGFYNEWGGWSLGQAFGPDGRPRVGEYMGTPMPEGLPFPEGTVVAKVLTTSAPVDCVPFLVNSPEWQVDRHAQDASGRYTCEREVQMSRVVQVDVAVVDLRSPTRWVYGTFAYDGTVQGDDFWDRLVPVGLQWGADPLSFPAVPQAQSRPVQQSVLNHAMRTFQHFGCNGRLAGPVDNALSSCVSCHSSAFAAPGGAPSVMGTNVPDSFGFPGICTVNSRDNENYFQTIAAPMSYSGGQFPDALSLDTSLQLAVAFTEYGYYNTQGAPRPCQNPNQG